MTIRSPLRPRWPLLTPSAWRTLLVGGVLVVGVVSAATSWAQPAGQPFLWKVERPGASPVWLFGTIHVPDARVLALAPAARRAFASSSRVVTEIPLDQEAQLGVAEALLLPEDQRLTDILGQDRFDRVRAVFAAALEDQNPLVGMALLGALDRLKPWAAMAQLVVLDYLPDMLDGRPSLDARLYADAQAAGKALSALETVQEQVRVFEEFTAAEQVALLDAMLQQVERPDVVEQSPGRQLVDLYLSGDSARLEAASRAQAPSDPALADKFDRVLLRDRNHRMADRLDALRATYPADVLFVAVGALHLVGADNLPALLEARGNRVTRVRE